MTDSEILNHLIDIEMTLSHQQKAIEELSDVVIKQGKTIDILARQNEWLKEVLKDQDIVKPLSEETPPPHY